MSATTVKDQEETVLRRLDEVHRLRALHGKVSHEECHDHQLRRGTDAGHQYPSAGDPESDDRPQLCRCSKKANAGCAKVCPTGAINYEMQEEFITEEVGPSSRQRVWPHGYRKAHRVRWRTVSRRHHRHPVRAVPQRLRPDIGPHHQAVGPRRAEDNRFRFLCGVPRQVPGRSLLLQLLLHVHRQTGHSDEGPYPRFTVLRLLHGRQVPG